MAETSSDMTKLVVLIEAQTRLYERAMQKVLQSTDGAVAGATKKFSSLDRTLKQIEDGSGRVGASIRKMEAELAAAAGAAVAPMQLNVGQLQNMQFQMNDMAMMLASGQNPFTTIMQQGSQIAQIFGPGSTLMGALKATGAGIATFLTNPINLAVFGFAAAAGAAPKIWEALTGPEAQKAEDLLKSVDDLLSELEKGYEGAADAARKFMDAATSGDQLLAMFQRTESQLRAGLAKAIEELQVKTLAFTGVWGDFSPEVKRAQAEIEELGRQLQDGEITARQFADEIADIRLAENTPQQIRDLADRLLEAASDAQKLEAALLGVAEAAAMANKAVSIDPARFDQDTKSRDEIMADLAAQLRSQASSITGPKTKTRKQEKSVWHEFGQSDELLDFTSDLNDMMKELEKQTEANRQAFKSLATGIVNDMRRGASGTEILSNALANLGNKFVDVALNAVASSLFPSFAAPDPWAGLRFRAVGGPVAAGSPYMVGENGPEVFVPNVGGKIVSNAKAGGTMGGGNVYNIDARGADAAAVARLERSLDERDRMFAKNVTAVNSIQRSRGVRP